MIFRWIGIVIGLPLWGIGSLFWAPKSAVAVVFPELTNGNTQVISLVDPKVDASLVLKLVSEASSVEYVTYLHSDDPEFGRPFAQAVGSAVSKGAELKALYDQFPTLTFDPFGRSTRSMLSASPKRGAAQIIGLSMGAKASHGLSVTDNFHQKIMILNRGTPREMIFIKGRNHNHLALTELDYAILIRPFDASQPYLGDQVKVHFDDTWALASRIQTPKRSLGHEKKEIPFDLTSFLEKNLTSLESRENFDSLTRLLLRPADRTAPRHPLEFRPPRIKLVSNDVIHQAITGLFGVSFEDRSHLESDISTEVIKVIQQAGRGKIRMSSMTPKISPPVLKAVKDSIESGSDFILYTNTEEAHTMSKGLGLAYGISELRSIAESGERARAEGNKPGSRILALVPNAMVPERRDAVEYLHFKGLITETQSDGSRRGVVVVTGDNLNPVSAVKADELAVFFADPEFAEHLSKHLDSKHPLFKEYSFEELSRRERCLGLLKKTLLHVMRHFM